MSRPLMLKGFRHLGDLLCNGCNSQFGRVHRVRPWVVQPRYHLQKPKKTDVAEHPKAFHHVGLLVNEPPGTDRAALYIVIRKFRLKTCVPPAEDSRGLQCVFSSTRIIGHNPRNTVPFVSCALLDNMSLACAKHHFNTFCQIASQTARHEIRIGIRGQV